MEEQIRRLKTLLAEKEKEETKWQKKNNKLHIDRDARFWKEYDRSTSCQSPGL